MRAAGLARARRCVATEADEHRQRIQGELLDQCRICRRSTQEGFQEPAEPKHDCQCNHRKKTLQEARRLRKRVGVHDDYRRPQYGGDDQDCPQP
jgi:hypothetical protein